MVEQTPSTPNQQNVPKYVSLAELVQAADDLLAQVAERTDDDDQLERVRRARQQLFATRDDTDADDLATDGGVAVDAPDDAVTEISVYGSADGSVEVHMSGELKRAPTLLAFAITREADGAGISTEQALRDIIAEINRIPGPEHDEIATDGGVAVDRVDDDGDVWSRPVVEHDARGDRTGFKFVRCLDCGAEVLKQHTDNATHKPGCRHR